MNDEHGVPLLNRLTSRTFLSQLMVQLGGAYFVATGQLDAETWLMMATVGATGYGLANAVGKKVTAK